MRNKIKKTRKQLKRIKQEGGNQRIVKHYWYKDWPDHGIPPNEEYEYFKNFIRILFEDIDDNKGGTVIHCSAGVGRTGVVYIILYLMFNITETTITINHIIDSIKEARKHRMYMVQTPAQFELICKLLNVYVTSDDIARFNALPEKDEYKLTLYAKLPANKIKNRYTNILPYDQNRIVLPSENSNTNTPPDDDYINASNMKPFCDGCNVIATQCPLPITITDFHKMIAFSELDIKRIVMLGGLVDSTNINKCIDYYNNLSDAYAAGKLTERLKYDNADIATYKYTYNHQPNQNIQITFENIGPITNDNTIENSTNTLSITMNDINKRTIPNSNDNTIEKKTNTLSITSNDINRRASNPRNTYLQSNNRVYNAFTRICIILSSYNNTVHRLEWYNTHDKNTTPPNHSAYKTILI